MKFNLYQLAIALISIGMIYQGILKYIKGKSGQTFLKLGVRLLVWGGMLGMVLFPSFTNTLANLIGIETNVHAAILTGFLLVFLIIFKLLSAIEKLEQEISILTRKDSLEELIQKK